MKKPIISFIVPSYNFAPYISGCVKSILNQSIAELEVIVVNDGSTDNTEEVLAKLAEEDCRVVPINKQNEGVSVARNAGMSVAKGEYVTFVDADDYLALDYAEYMLKLATETGGEFCLSLDCYTKRDEPQAEKEFIKAYTPEEATALLLSPRVVVGSWNKIFKRDFLLSNLLHFSPDLFYGEGLRFITSAAQCATCVGVGNRKVYYYKRNNYSSATSKFNIEKFYNGLKSIDEIGEDLRFSGKHLLAMWGWHRCQFCMGAVVRIESAKKKSEYRKFYKECLGYVRKNFYKYLNIKGVGLYKKSLLIGCAISPKIMASLDDWRRRRIAANSVENYSLNA